MKICFLARPLYDEYSIAIFSKMLETDAGTEGCFVVLDDEEERKIIRKFANAHVYNFSSYYRKKENECTLEKFLFFEQKYECEPIWKYIYTDRFLIHRDYEYVVKTTVALFYYFEEVFFNEKPDFYFSENIATLFCYIAYLVGKKSGTQYITLIGARGLFSQYHYVSIDPFQGIVGFDRNYLTKEYSEDEKKWARDFLNDFRNNFVPPDYMKICGKKPRLKMEYIRLLFSRVFGRFKFKYNNKYSYIYYKAYEHAMDPIFFYFRYQMSRKYYHKPDNREKYVLYPLHFQPEASTLVCAEKYEKQLYFIDSWAKSLPADTLLYVKEHYAYLGHRSLSFYKELEKYPNVKLIDPWINTQELIKGAQAVTTLTGTAGWEAMLLKKPVFIGGNIYFDNAPGIIKISDIFDNYVSSMENWKQTTDNEIIQYLCAYRQVIYEGNASGYDLSDANIKLIVKSLMKAVKTINHHTPTERAV